LLGHRIVNIVNGKIYIWADADGEMRVMLVYPNDRMDGLIPTSTSVLSSHLKNAGHDVRLYDTTFYDTGKEVGDSYREDLGQVIKVDLEKHGVVRRKMDPRELRADFRSAVRDYNPGLIGFSVLEITYDQGLELANGIRDIQIPKIAGGIYPTFSPKIVLREDAFDMICEGEGEVMLPELATALEQGRDITKILNLTVKQDGRIYRSGKVVGFEDLPAGDDYDGDKMKTGLRRPQTHMQHELLSPDYSIYSDQRFWKKMGGKAVRTVAMELSRGCPYKCTFCCVPNQQQQHRAARDIFRKEKGGLELSVLGEAQEEIENDPYHREKPIDKFIGEVQEAREKHGIDFIYFTDESFLSMREDRFQEFIEKYGRIGLPFFIETRVETVRPGYAGALESVGCAGVAMGVESGDLELRKNLLKRMMPDSTIVKGFREFEKTRIRISANNIIGFPTETRDDIMKTIGINRQINPDSTVVNAFRPYSGTPLRTKCLEMGLIPEEERAEDNRAYGAFYNGVMTGEEIEGIRRVFNFYVKFDKDRWGEVRSAETDDVAFERLREEYIEDRMLHRRKRGLGVVEEDDLLGEDEMFIIDPGTTVS
jgi:anaerobic magnesium-protoporphyrin IX monomethyl ester cyclase